MKPSLLFAFTTSTSKKMLLPIKHLTSTETETKAISVWDLSYNYDDKYGSEHRCKVKQLFLIAAYLMRI